MLLSPTGQLHVGNARTALFNWLLAHGQDGTFILRIEDTDAERSTRESEPSILEDLRWLGLDWDEGPDVGGPHGPYRQSERLHLYASYANELIARRPRVLLLLLAGAARSRSPGGSRGRQAAAISRHLPRTCRRARRAARIEAGERPVIRFKVPESTEVTFNDLVRGDVTFNTEVIGDPVLVRSDGRPAYNFAVVVDDALMEITHVIRGEDHISNTPRQLLLYQALGFTPPQFAHLSLVMGPDHTPLSKRHGATSVAEFRAARLSAGGAGQLPRADRLVARAATRRTRAAADRRAGAALRDRGRRAQRRRVRPREAGVDEPALHEGGGAGAARGASRCAISCARGFVAAADRRGDRSTSRRCCRWRSGRSIGSKRSRIGCGSCSSSTPAAALRAAEVAHVLEEPGAREVIARARRRRSTAPLLDREAFRARRRG